MAKVDFEIESQHNPSGQATYITTLTGDGDYAYQGVGGASLATLDSRNSIAGGDALEVYKSSK